MQHQTTSHHTSSNNPQPSNHRGLIKLAAIVCGYALLAVLTLALILPVLARTDQDDIQRKSTTQVRGITQGLNVYASGNKERMPGTNSKGFILPDDGTENSLTGRSGHGATVEARFWLMLDNNMFTGDYIISPAETKTAWTTGQATSANYSYALLNLHSDKDLPPNKNTRPNQTNRAREWKQSINTQAVLVSDRARIPDAKIADNYDKIYSVHTSEEKAIWFGNIGRGDGSARFELSDKLDTKYGAIANLTADRLFAREQDSDPKTDIAGDEKFPARWDDNGNALLGYKSVGYQDPDIASE